MIDRNATPRKTTPQVRRGGIPEPTAAEFVTVNDGLDTVGTVVPNDGSFFAFDNTGTLCGEFRSMTEAMRVLPKRVRS